MPGFLEAGYKVHAVDSETGANGEITSVWMAEGWLYVGGTVRLVDAQSRGVGAEHT
jgi:hypothetical protein